MKLKQIIRFNLICGALALCLAGAWLVAPRSVAGQAAQPVTLRGAEAIEQLKRDGRYESLRAALNQALFNESHTMKTPLGGATWHASNPAAGYQVVTEAEDHDPAYPLMIDPLFTFQQRLAAVDGQARDRFGAAVALSGDTAVIGAPMSDWIYYDQGGAYVFARNGGTWTQLQKLTASDGAAGDYFGYAVALSGDTLVVGAPYAAGSNVQQGSAYVFTRNGGYWTEQQKLTANDGAADDYFGYAVALDGDTAVVGAYGDDIGSNVEQGSAYVFVRSGATQPVWTQQQKLSAGDGAAGDSFGLAVALVGDTLVACAPFDNIGANQNQGSAYFFTRSGSVWTQKQKLTASDGAANDRFGIAVALSDDKLVVGAPYATVGSYYQQGSAYAFASNGAVWTERQKLIADDGMGDDRFGSAIALGGDTLVVSAPNDVTGYGVELGSASVFAFIGSWVPQETLTTASGASNEVFGHAVAINNDTVIAGAPGRETLTQFYRGSVYAFVRPTCPALTLDPASLPNSASGASYQQQLTVSGGAGPFQFWLGGGALPPGLTLTQNGLLSGTPTAQGTYSFTIRVTDLSSFCSGGRAYTLTIAPPCSNLRVNPPSLPKGKTGTAYSETLTAKNGAAPYQFSVTGSLPPGLSLSAGGVLSGTPTQAGSFSFTVLVTDANGCAGSRGYTLTIN